MLIPKCTCTALDEPIDFIKIHAPNSGRKDRSPGWKEKKKVKSLEQIFSSRTAGRVQPVSAENARAFPFYFTTIPTVIKDERAT